MFALLKSLSTLPSVTTRTPTDTEPRTETAVRHTLRVMIQNAASRVPVEGRYLATKLTRSLLASLDNASDREVRAFAESVLEIANALDDACERDDG